MGRGGGWRHREMEPSGKLFKLTKNITEGHRKTKERPPSPTSWADTQDVTKSAIGLGEWGRSPPAIEEK